MKKGGSLFGGVLLITGSCVGAGMLGLPILSGLAGFGPSLVMFAIAWLFMTYTGLLLVEANGWFPKQVNLVSMFGSALGKPGKALCWVTYLFLFYALLVAYISASGSLFSSITQNYLHHGVPSWIGSVVFVLLFGVVVLRGTRQVDLWNRVLMFVKILCFLLLGIVTARYVRSELLASCRIPLAFFALPILVVSFGFHNMIPSLTAYFQGDLRKVKKAIWFGGAFAFALYIVWQVLVLGVVPFAGASGLLNTFLEDREGAQALASVLQNSSVPLFAQGLAFFAILTSFLAQALSFVHFLADGCRVSYEKKESLSLCLLALAPPLALALIQPKLFFQALNFAGGICAVVLFGVLPVLTVWIGRYRKDRHSPYMLMGGKPMLLAIVLFSICIFLLELATLSGVLDLTRSAAGYA